MDGWRRRIHTFESGGSTPEVTRRRLRLRSDYWELLTNAPHDEQPPGTLGAAPRACGCEKTGIVPVSELLDAAERFAKLRPPPRWEIDQVHTFPRDMARRVAFLMEEDDVDGKDLLFVGDDDFCSTLVCTVAKPRRVVVVDIDERILETLSEQARIHGWPLEVYPYDLDRYVDEGMPAELDSSFDVFVTDPPYSLTGMILFCAFGMNALRDQPGAIGYVAVPWMADEEWSDELLFAVQRSFLDQGFFLPEVRSAFHGYEQRERPAYVFDDDGLYSSMLRARSFLRGRKPHQLVETTMNRYLYSFRSLAPDARGDRGGR
jgi:hypothetical protein